MAVCCFKHVMIKNLFLLPGRNIENLPQMRVPAAAGRLVLFVGVALWAPALALLPSPGAIPLGRAGLVRSSCWRCGDLVHAGAGALLSSSLLSLSPPTLSSPVGSGILHQHIRVLHKSVSGFCNGEAPLTHPLSLFQEGVGRAWDRSRRRP